MMLLTKKLRRKLPPLYSNEDKGLDRSMALVKFFAPWSNYTAWFSEFDGKDIFFGLVSCQEVELGYSSLSELEAVRGPMGLKIERDLYFEPTSLQTLLDRANKERHGT